MANGTNDDQKMKDFMVAENSRIKSWFFQGVSQGTNRVGKASTHEPCEIYNANTFL
jgi:hypothetical protein